jgi:hypothetical protein
LFLEGNCEVEKLGFVGEKGEEKGEENEKEFWVR